MVEHDDESGVVCRADESAEALLEKYHSLGQLKFAERIAARFADSFDAGFGNRRVGHGEGELGDDDIPQRLPSHIHALPKTHRPHQHASLLAAEPLEHGGALKFAALDKQLVIVLVAPRADAVAQGV